MYEKPASLEAAKRGVDLVCASGVRAERWSADEIREREPAIIGRQVGGYFYPDDAHCEPYRAVRALEAEARSLGVQVLEETEVYRISNGSGTNCRSGSGSARNVTAIPLCQMTFCPIRGKKSGAWIGCAQPSGVGCSKSPVKGWEAAPTFTDGAEGAEVRCDDAAEGVPATGEGGLLAVAAGRGESSARAGRR